MQEIYGLICIIPRDPANVARYGEGGKKVYADVYIDDKNLGGFLGWDIAYDMICELV